MFGDFPTLTDPRHADAYSPLWDAQLGLWTDKAVKQGLNTRQIDEVQVFNLAATRPDLLTGVDPATGQPAPYGSVGVDINCAVIGFTDKAPTANLAEPGPRLAVPAPLTATRDGGPGHRPAVPLRKETPMKTALLIAVVARRAASPAAARRHRQRPTAPRRVSTAGIATRPHPRRRPRPHALPVREGPTRPQRLLRCLCAATGRHCSRARSRPQDVRREGSHCSGSPAAATAPRRSPTPATRSTAS